MSSDAYRVFGEAGSAGPFLFTCEHASNALPESVRISPADRGLLEQHWGWDIGARDVVEALVLHVGGQGVASTFSRLWIDPNRAPLVPSLIVDEIDGQGIEFNLGAETQEGGEERSRRIREYFEPYHRAIEVVGARRSALNKAYQVLSVHSFTPLYLGKTRPMEIGVLFNDHDEDAWHMQEALIGQGFETALNAPYTGKPPGGLIYAAQRHGEALGVPYLELEIRQDLIDSQVKAMSVGKRIASALEAYVKLRSPRR